MKVTKEKLPKSKIKLIIEIEPDEVQPFLDVAAKEESKKHPVKGFRPGQVPFDVMRSAIGDHHLVETALQKLVPKTYVDALLEDKEIEAIGRPEIEAKEVEIGKNWVYEATVSMLPDIKLGEYKSVKETKKQMTVEDKEVDTEIEELRKMRASYVTVQRVAEKGDRVDIDINVSADGVPLEDGNARKQSVILGDSHLFPEFEVQIIGAKEGETKEFPIKFPADHPQKDLQNKTVDFKIKVLTVQQQNLPEINDNFAQGMGKFANIDELKVKIKENILLEKEYKETQRLQQALLEQVVEKTTFEEIPELLVENELDKMVSEMEEGITQIGLTMEQYLLQIKKTQEQMRDGLKEQAMKRIKSGLTLRSIAKIENIEVSDDEVQKEMIKFLQRFPSAEEAKKQVDIEALTEITVGTLRNKKVFELLEKLAGI
ncbi:MAG: trigger factor [bacterium]|nr:trigger factor [bacterium]